MTLKTVLAITSPGLDTGDIQQAVTLCQQIDAHLSVFVIALAAPPPIGDAAVMSDAWSEERDADLKQLEERTTEVAQYLASTSISSDITSEYREQTWADEAIGRRARYADITLLSPQMLSHAILKGKILDGALFVSGKPLLLVPAGSVPSLKPAHVMVAWDSGIEASNAVSRALALLCSAEDVHVVLVDPIEGDRRQGAEPGADIAAYLARHGIKVTVDRLPSHGRTVADILRRHSIDVAAELVVMGAYGHSRLRERIFGGVTRSMIENPPLPLFLSR